MSLRTGDENQAVKYLLGKLAEQEQVQLEERFFHDEEFSELLSEVEDDLIDQYVREELSTQDRERFEQHFLISGRRHNKLIFARSLLKAQGASTISTAPIDLSPAESPSLLRKIFGATPGSVGLRPALSYGFAALALIGLIGAGLLLVKVRSLQTEVARISDERNFRERRNEELLDEVEKQRQRNDELSLQKQSLEQQIASLQEQGGNPDRGLPAVLSFLLLPGSRGSDSATNIRLTQGADSVRLQLKLNPLDDYPVYQVKLQTASGQTVRTWAALRAVSTAGAKVVAVVIPARLLNAESYELTLSGSDRSNRVDTLGYYYFHIAR